MIKSKKFLILFSLPLFFMLAVTVYLKISRNLAPEVKIAATGYDPRSLISGHYLQLSLDWDTTDCSQFSDAKCPGKYDFQAVYRFYVSEDQARDLENQVRQPGVKTELLFALPAFGEPQLKKLLINGKEWNK